MHTKNLLGNFEKPIRSSSSGMARNVTINQNTKIAVIGRTARTAVSHSGSAFEPESRVLPGYSDKKHWTPA